MARMNTAQMALLAALAKDIENMSLRLTELVCMSMTGEEQTEWRALPELIVTEVAAKRPNYNHHHWPSPRAKRIANTILQSAKPIRKHEDAIQYLADRAGITVEHLLTMSSQEYAIQYP